MKLEAGFQSFANTALKFEGNATDHNLLISNELQSVAFRAQLALGMPHLEWFRSQIDSGMPQTVPRRF
jgi:hypothetical protein